MSKKIKNIINPTTNMHYLEVIDWIKDRSAECSSEAVATAYFFENETDNNNDLKNKVKSKIKEIINYKK